MLLFGKGLSETFKTYFEKATRLLFFFSMFPYQVKIIPILISSARIRFAKSIDTQDQSWPHHNFNDLYPFPVGQTYFQRD